MEQGHPVAVVGAVSDEVLPVIADALSKQDLDARATADGD